MHVLPWSETDPCWDREPCHRRTRPVSISFLVPWRQPDLVRHAGFMWGEDSPVLLTTARPYFIGTTRANTVDGANIHSQWMDFCGAVAAF